jgi:hypothetical protein
VQASQEGRLDHPLAACLLALRTDRLSSSDLFVAAGGGAWKRSHQQVDLSGVQRQNAKRLQAHGRLPCSLKLQRPGLKLRGNRTSLLDLCCPSGWCPLMCSTLNRCSDPFASSVAAWTSAEPHDSQRPLVNRLDELGKDRTFSPRIASLVTINGPGICLSRLDWIPGQSDSWLKAGTHSPIEAYQTLTKRLSRGIHQHVCVPERSFHARCPPSQDENPVWHHASLARTVGGGLLMQPRWYPVYVVGARPPHRTEMHT